MDPGNLPNLVVEDSGTSAAVNNEEGNRGQDDTVKETVITENTSNADGRRKAKRGKKRLVDSEDSDSDSQVGKKRRKRRRRFQKTDDASKIKSSRRIKKSGEEAKSKTTSVDKRNVTEGSEEESSQESIVNTEMPKRSPVRGWRQTPISEEAKARVRGISQNVFPDLYGKTKSTKTGKSKKNGNSSSKQNSNHVEGSDEWIAEMLLNTSNEHDNQRPRCVNTLSSEALRTRNPRDVFDFAENSEEEAIQIKEAQKRSAIEFRSIRDVEDSSSSDVSSPNPSSENANNGPPLKMTFVRNGSNYEVRNNSAPTYSNPILQSILGPLDNQFNSTGWVKERCGAGADTDWFRSPHITSNATVGPCPPDPMWGIVTERSSSSEEEFAIQGNTSYGLNDSDPGQVSSG